MTIKGMLDDGEENSVVDELELDLNQFCKARPNLGPEKLDADGLVDFDRKIATNKSQPLPANKIVNKYLPQPAEPVENGSSDKDEVPNEPISPPTQNEVDKELKS